MRRMYAVLRLFSGLLACSGISLAIAFDRFVNNLPLATLVGVFIIAISGLFWIHCGDKAKVNTRWL